jgi:hypothetical protein
MAKLTPPIKTHTEKAPVQEVVAQAKPKAPTDQSPPNEIVPLQLKIPTGKRNEFKAYAAMRGHSMNALFLEMFEQYKQNNT